MEAVQSYLKFSIIAVLLIAGTMVLDYLTLHDIYQDYLSPVVLESLHINWNFPVWTEAELEWNWVKITFVTRLILISALLLLMVQSYQTIKKSKSV